MSSEIKSAMPTSAAAERIQWCSLIAKLRYTHPRSVVPERRPPKRERRNRRRARLGLCVHGVSQTRQFRISRSRPELGNGNLRRGERFFSRVGFDRCRRRATSDRSVLGCGRDDVRQRRHLFGWPCGRDSRQSYRWPARPRADLDQSDVPQRPGAERRRLVAFSSHARDRVGARAARHRLHRSLSTPRLRCTDPGRRDAANAR